MLSISQRQIMLANSNYSGTTGTQRSHLVETGENGNVPCRSSPWINKKHDMSTQLLYHQLDPGRVKSKVRTTAQTNTSISKNSPVQQSFLSASEQLHAEDMIISPKRKTSGSSKRGTKSGSRGTKAEAAPQPPKPKFPTDFAGSLCNFPPPVPPQLLRVGLCAPPIPTKRDQGSKMKVAVRVMSSGNSPDSPEPSYLRTDSRKKQIIMNENNLPDRRSTAGPKLYNFDAVFSQDAGQTEICSSSLVELIQTVISGSDGTFLCLGSDFDCKKVSTLGIPPYKSAQGLGCLPSAISWLFRSISELKERNNVRYSVRVSALEIHGPQETLRDLLVDKANVFGSTDQAFYGTSSAGPSTEVTLKEDPVFGTQVQNLSELRAPTPEQAAFYLDAALAARNQRCTEDKRNSHFFFTLHLYQYSLDASGCGSVAGGRSRLNLVELGSGERSSKPGRCSLSLPSIGNVLVTLLQGQKHLPNKESKLTQVLKDVLGGASCKSVSILNCITSDPDCCSDTFNVIQLAARLFRIRRKRIKLGTSSNESSDGASSGADDRGFAGRKRFPRSTSEPDCATSSSEQSCDTVIYLGPPARKYSDRFGGGSDSESGASILRQPIRQFIPSRPNNCTIKPMGSGLCREQTPDPKPFVPKENGPYKDMAYKPTSFKPSAALQFFNPSHALHTVPEHVAISNGSPVRTPVHNLGSLNTTPNVSPYKSIKIHRSNHHYMSKQQVVTTEEIWIDGPNALAQANEKTKNQTHKNGTPKDPLDTGLAPFLDASKRETIEKWIQGQTPRSSKPKEIWVDFPPAMTDAQVGPGSDANTAPLAETESPSLTNSHEAMSSKSGVSNEPVEMVSIGLQADDYNIDHYFANGQYSTNDSDLTEKDYMWTIPEQEVRYLEDIQEEPEDISSSGARSIHSQHEITPDSYRFHHPSNQCLFINGLNPLGLSLPFQTSRPHSNITVDSDNSNAIQHPLRILSKERITPVLNNFGQPHGEWSLSNKSSSFSLTDHLETLSLPAYNDGVDDDEELDDEDLEKAMAASMTSIRSLDLLELLKKESQQPKSELRLIDLDDALASHVHHFSDFNGNPPGLKISVEEDSVGPEASIAAAPSPAKSQIPIKLSPRSPKAHNGVIPCDTSTLDTSLSRDGYQVDGQENEFVSSVAKKEIPNSLALPKEGYVTTELKTQLSRSAGLAKFRNRFVSGKNKMNQAHSRSKSSGANGVPAQPIIVNAQPTSISQEFVDTGKPGKRYRSAVPNLPSQIEKEVRETLIQGQNQTQVAKPKIPHSIKQQRQEITTESVSQRSSRRNSHEKMSDKGTMKPKNGSVLVNDKLETVSKSAGLKAPKVQAKSVKGKPPSPLMSFLRSPSHRVTLKSPASQQTLPGIKSGMSPGSVSNRASSGYDSGHDSGILSVAGASGSSTSPEVPLSSPYSKVTKPRLSYRSSSGHGSDNSSAVSSDPGCSTRPGHRLPLNLNLRRKQLKETSSGYDSPGSGSTHQFQHTVTTKESSDSEVSSPGRRTPPSCKIARKKFIISNLHSRSKSAPQSPSSGKKAALLRLCESQVDDAMNQKASEMMKNRQVKVIEIKIQQQKLKDELLAAKNLLTVPRNRWSYELHVEDCMNPEHPSFIEALEQETKILEKRVAACKSHLLMITVFDATPNRT